MLACYEGDTDMIKLLLDYSGDRNIDLNAIDICGTTAFMIACDGGRKDVVKLLLDHSEDRKIVLNARDEHGRTALVRACMKGNKDVVKLLLDHSVDRKIVLNPKDKYSRWIRRFITAPRVRSAQRVTGIPSKHKKSIKKKKKL